MTATAIRPLMPITDYLSETANSLLVEATALALLWDDLDPVERQRHSQALRLLFTIDSGRTSAADRDTARWALAELIEETFVS